jgi:hypothetical protein
MEISAAFKNAIANTEFPINEKNIEVPLNIYKKLCKRYTVLNE